MLIICNKSTILVEMLIKGDIILRGRKYRGYLSSNTFFCDSQTTLNKQYML